MKKLLTVFLFFIFNFLSAQTYIGFDTINKFDNAKNKAGIWMEETKSGIEIGKYKDGKKNGNWESYTRYGELIESKKYTNGRYVKSRKIRASFGNEQFGKNNIVYSDSITLKVYFNNQKDIRNWAESIRLDSVTTTIFSIKDGIATKENTFSSKDKTDIKITFLKNSYSLLIFEKNGYIKQKILVDFRNANGFPSNIQPWQKQLTVRLNNRINNEVYSLSTILNKPNEIINYNPNESITKDYRYFSYLQYSIKNLSSTIKDSLIKIKENEINSDLLGAKSELETKVKQITQLEEDNLLKQNELLKKEMLSQAKEKEIQLLNKDKALQQLFLLQNQQQIKQQELEAQKNQQELEIANQSRKIKQVELYKKNLELDHQIALKNQQNKELVLQTELKNSIKKEASQQNIIKWIFAGLALLFVVFSFISFKRYKESQKQKLIIESQKALVEEKQKEMIDSIHYAKRIQQSLLPTEKYIDKSLNRLKNDIN